MRRVLTWILDAKNRTGRAFRTVRKDMKATVGDFRNIGTAITAGVFAVATKKLLDISIAAEETGSKFSTIFGRMSDDVGEFARDYGVKLGIVNNEAKGLLATSGHLLQQFGFTSDASADLSKKIFTLAGDVASFSNVTGGAPRVIDALNKALLGEREMLKGVGIAIAENEVVTQALIETGKKNAAELTRQDRAAATLTLAYQKAGVAIGDVDRTFDSNANKIRRIQARWGNMVEFIAVSLTPAFTDVIDVLEENSEGFIAIGEAAAKGITIAIDFGRKFSGGLQLMAVDAAEATFRISVWKATVIEAVGDVVGFIGEKIGSFVAKLDALPEPVKAFLGLGGLARFSDWAREFEESTNRALQASLQQMEAAKQAADEARLAIVGGVDEQTESVDEAASARIAKLLAEANAGSGVRRTGGRGGGEGDSLPSFIDFLEERREEAARARNDRRNESEFIVGQNVFDAVDIASPRLEELSANLEIPEATLSSWENLRLKILDADSGVGALLHTAGLLGQTTGELSGLWEQVFTTIGEGGDLSAASFGDAFQGMFGRLAASAGQFYASKAIAALGEGFLGQPGAFVAAAKFGAASAGFYALSGKLGGGGGRSSGGSVGTAGFQSSQSEGSALFDSRTEREVVIVGDPYLDMTNPKIREAFANAIDVGEETRLTIRYEPGAVG